MTDPKNTEETFEEPNHKDIRLFIELKLAPVAYIVGAGVLDFFAYQVFTNKHFKYYLFLDFFREEKTGFAQATAIFGLFVFALVATDGAIIMLMLLFGVLEEHDDSRKNRNRNL